MRAIIIVRLKKGGDSHCDYEKTAKKLDEEGLVGQFFHIHKYFWPLVSGYD